MPRRFARSPPRAAGSSCSPPTSTGLNQAFDEATGSFGGKVAVSAQVPPEVEASGKFAIVTVTLDDTEFTGTSQLPRSEELVAEGGAAGGATDDGRHRRHAG